MISEKSDKPDKENKPSVISRLAGSTALLAAVLIVLAIYFFQMLHSDFFNQAYTAPLTNWTMIIAEKIIEDPTVAKAAARSHQIGIILDYPEYTKAYDRQGLEIAPSLLLENAENFRQITVTIHDLYKISFFLEKDVFGQMENRPLIGVVIGILIVVSVIYLVQLSWLRPLQWLRNGVEKVANGDFSTRVPIVRNDEIGQVGRAFNYMTEQVLGMMEDRDRLLADVSHELRSPMARMRVALEMMPKNKYSANIERDILQMEALTTALLEREKLIGGTSLKKTESVNINAILAEICERVEKTAPGINCHIPENPIRIRANRELLLMLFQNLIDNSIKFSKPDSAPISITAQIKDKQIKISVDDDGIGISKEDTERVFKPFVKLDAARGHGVGYGLGLNLCQRIVQAHGGSIAIDPKAENGLRIVVKLPLGK